MVSQKMIDDAEELAERGIRLTPREIVRLNALGLRCERGTMSSSLHAIRRCAICGDLAFGEPTIGHAVWLDEAARAYDMSDPVTWFTVRALWMSTVRHTDLPEWRNAEAFFSAVKEFGKRLATHTLREVAACLDYAEHGALPEDGEAGPKRQRGDVPPALGEAVPDENWSGEIGVVREAQYLGLGISLSDAMGMTHAQLRRVVDSAYDRLGAKASEDRVNTAVGDYELVLEEITKAHEGDGANG